MSIKEYFYPEVIKKFDSKFNEDVQLIRLMGDLRLDMGDLTQSGSVIEKIWSKAFSHLIPKSAEIKSVLILGLGGGSAIKIVDKFFKGASVTTVEIDPVVVDIATNYFPFVKKYKARVICDDAVSFLKTTKEHFDLVVVDCYQGYKVPPKLASADFIESIIKKTNYLLINRLFWSEFKKPAMEFKGELEKKFKVETTRTPSNLILSVIQP
jgi:spermidine synthase